MSLKIKAIMLLLVSIMLSACSSTENITLKVTNPSTVDVKDGLVSTTIGTDLNKIRLQDGEKIIPYQIIEKENKQYLTFVTDIDKGGIKEIKISKTEVDEQKTFKQRTYAELSRKQEDVYYDKRFRGNKFVKVQRLKVPAIHTDHDALFKYEGPGWESEKVGYRFYLDWRNATDIFGKKFDKILLENVGTTDTVAKDDSYHSMQPWGMDIFKVGSTLGIGSIGLWADNKVNMVSVTDSVICSIPYTGPVEAKIITDYYGWKVGNKKYDLTAELSITAGSRLTKCEININNNAENIVTGLAKYPKTELIKGNNKEGWNYLALYGNQTLVNENDKLGIVVFYRADEMKEVFDDVYSHVVKLQPVNGKVTYYFAAAWEQEENGIKNIDEFKKYLDETVRTLNKPLIVEIK